MKDIPHDPRDPWSRPRGQGSVAKHTNHDVGPFGFGRNLASDRPDHLYRSARLSVGGGDKGKKAYRVGWFYAHVRRVTYEFDKHGHWSFSIALRIGRLNLGVHPSWALGTRDG